MSNQCPLDLAHVAKVPKRTRKLAEEFYKSIIRKFETQKVRSSYTDDIQGADLADMQ